ncbi:TatD family deoxyribonuclease [Dyella monticola]|uniref:TatD family deoxyribonuclease n=1 Tax=Dyella monticola TaxID=1927958 RepID=A0A370WWX4_9GAMM|nr:TatD family hydrolase [Dyella monticola]RDS80556.1 TatD family deoxyribonuclease [Dyella monticola]
MLKLADSHVHLDDASFDTDRDAVIARARGAGVSLQIIPGVDTASWPRIHALCTPGSGLFPAYGMHPMFMHKHQPEDLSKLSHWLTAHRPVALGEIGLDFHERTVDAEGQRDYFMRQLMLAREWDLPVIVHARAAMDEVTTTLRRIGKLRGVVHSFSGSLQQAEQLWKLGFHIGIGGPVTYERAQRLRSIVATMPIEYLMLESDAPDQPLSTHRGQRNEPARVTEVLQCIAQLRNEAQERIAAATTANVRQLFAISD